MKSKIYKILIIIFSSAFIFSSSVLIFYIYNSSKESESYMKIAAMVENSTVTETPIPYDDDEFFLPEYYELYHHNNDLAGWIYIEGTQINYPVMQTPDRSNYYLRRNFERKYSYSGTPYIQENCMLRKDNASDNIIIYAHNMTDGSMFGSLSKYLDKEYWENHKIIQFNTLTQYGRYEVMSVFTTSASSADSERFDYHKFTDAENENEFNEYVNNCKKLNWYDTNVIAEYGDKLLTLSTCEYSREHGRLVVVAKKIEE